MGKVKELAIEMHNTPKLLKSYIKHLENEIMTEQAIRDQRIIDGED